MNNLSQLTKILLLFLIAMLNFNHSKGQSGIIFGKIKNIETNKPVMYAAVSIYEQNDSSLYLSTITNDEGAFSIGQVKNGTYYLKTSCLGFNESVIENILISSNQQKYNCETIELKEKSFLIEEIQVTANRARGKSDNEKTIYTVKNEMKNTSYNGTELLKYIPGIQLDLQKNIYLEGKSNVIILVNGKERDKNFLDQLNSEWIDRIEVSVGSSSKFDADAAGIVNIILKKDENEGFGSSVNLDLPLTTSGIFSNPSYSLSYGKRKLNLLLSYTGGFYYFDIESNRTYNTFSNNEDFDISNSSALKQKSWNQRINLSIDYSINKKNSITFYSYYNPHKNNFDGKTESEIISSESNHSNINYSNNEKDRNTANLYSLFYKHSFDKNFSELTVDLSFYNFNGKSSYSVWDINQKGNYSNLPTDNSEYNTKYHPNRFSNYLKLDYTTKVNDKIKLDLGSKFMYSNYKNKDSNDFKYTKKNLASYIMATYQHEKIVTTLGMRGEYLNSSLEEEFNKDYYSILPYFVISYKLKNNNTLKLNYKVLTFRPGLYDLNSAIIANDLYSAKTGNPDLSMEHNNIFALEYTTQIKSSYMAIEGYYEFKKNNIHHIGELTSDGLILFTPQNIEREINYGLKLSGSLSILRLLHIVPFFKFYQYEINNEANLFYQNYKTGTNINASLSAILMLKNNLSLSLIYQYTNPEYFIQNRTFTDVLYFLGIDKKFGNNVKIGLASALPFKNSFTYYANKYNTENFKFNQNENITFSAFPFWFKFSYSFNSGKKAKIKQWENEMNEVKSKKIF